MSRGTQVPASGPVSFRLRDFHALWRSFPAPSPSLRIGNPTCCGPYNPPVQRTKVWAIPVSLAATPGISVDFFSLRVLRWFTSPGWLMLAYIFSELCPVFTPDGFPHSDILGSTPACDSPRLFAACHVLLRLLAPGHPPHALSSLTIKLIRRVATRISLWPISTNALLELHCGYLCLFLAIVKELVAPRPAGPNDKKPGVERRVSPPHPTGRTYAMLGRFLSCVRRKPQL